MTSLVLREIGTSSHRDEAVLELFAASRNRVVRVAASPLLPDEVAVTTANGFVELIQTGTGEFRLFLTHLDHIPLDASLRCFALVPSLYAASFPHQHHLLYSLSYSNELLMGNVETGVVRVLTTCQSRPSAVECDGDYVACGEGNGGVSLWRAGAEGRDSAISGNSAAAASPSLLWQAPLFDSTVTCLRLCRDQLVCCAADYRCVVVSVESGSIRASLPLELDSVVAAFPLTGYARVDLPDSIAVCLASRISVFASARPDDVTATPRLTPSTSPTSECWSEKDEYVVEPEQVACASCLGTHMALGTASGLVLLFSCDAATSTVRELVRFNVGYGVKGIQLFTNDTLLVVTSAGDVWRWPLGDLLLSAGGGSAATAIGADEAGATEGEPTPMTQPPLPQLPVVPGSVGAASPSLLSDATTPCDLRVHATPHELSQTQEGDAEDRNLPAQETSSLRHAGDQSGGVDVETATTAPDDAAAATACVSPFPADCGAVATSVLLSSASASSRAESVSAEEDAEEHVSREEGRDAKGTNAGASQSEPSTVLCLPPPPPSSETEQMEKGGKGWRGETGSARRQSTRSPPPLYDPEDVKKEPHLDRPAVEEVLTEPREDDEGEDGGGGDSFAAASPPSTADTTAHFDSQAADGDTQVLGRGTSTWPTGDNVDESKKGVGCGGRSVRTRRGNSLGGHGSSVVVLEEDDTSVGKADREGRATRKGPTTDELETEFVEAMTRLLGPAVHINGLRKGPRMSPRKIAGVLENEVNEITARAQDSAAPPPILGPNSTPLLEEKRTTIETAAFRFEEYRQAHRLEVDALQYQHPVKLPSYTLKDRVFHDVEPIGCIRDADVGAAAATASESHIGQANVHPTAKDELRDVTYGKVKWTVDPDIAEERRRGGPEMAQHHCDDLLFTTHHTSTAALLFPEEPLQPSTAWEEVLLLPMPLPPASPVF